MRKILYNHCWFNNKELEKEILYLYEMSVKLSGFDARKLRLWIYECKYNKLSPRIQLL